jgi:hypothetical protein
MLRCREITKLVSDSMDGQLPWRQRMQVWMHLAMCRLCSGFAKQLRFLRLAARRSAERPAEEDSAAEVKLSEEARQRISSALQRGES